MRLLGAAGTQGTAGRRYAWAVLLVAASALFRWALHDWLGARAQYMAFLPAVMAAAWLGGIGPGLMTVAVSSALAAALFVLPPSAEALWDAGEVAQFLLFVGVGAGTAWFCARLRSSEEALRQTAERAAAQAEELATILNTGVDAIIVIDERGVVERFNPGAERLFGYAAAEVLGRNVSVLMPSPDRERHDGYLARYLQTGEAQVIGVGREVRGRTKDGRDVPLHLSVGEMQVQGRRKFAGMLHDLTARVEREERARASEARWQAIVTSAVDGIIVIDGRGRIETFNPAAERLFGYTEQEVVGQNVSMLMPSPYREAHDGYLANYLATGQKKIIGVGREVQGRRRDGTVFPVHLSVGELTANGDRRFAGIVHDLTARTRMERQLAEQTALARLGEMAAVVAHEVKNPLAGIRGAIQVIGDRLPADNRDRPMIAAIVSRIDALGEMMRDLLLFARPPKPDLQAVDVRALLGSTADLLAQDPALAAVEVPIDGVSPPLRADPRLLQAVFLNLMVNAAQAMEGRGTLRVSIAADDGECRVAFADQGPGIPDGVREQIFTPFFTTKARGSGLGLPTSRRLVEAHGGTIDVECPPQGGTRVTVSLPRQRASDGV
jgi:two-component system sensor kinase FixL